MARHKNSALTKRLFILFFGLLVLGIFVYRQNIVTLFSYSSCDSPVLYRIGSIDSKFGLNNADVLADTKTAVNILGTAENKQLFEYSGTASLTINFVYDQRAALNSQINQLQAQVNQKGSTLSQQNSDYEAQVNQFEQKLAIFNATVEKYNSQGGAPSDAYQSLIQQQNQLNAQADALNQKARQLNFSVREYNVGVSSLNQDTNQFNSAIALKPEGGLYDPNNNSITLYFADNYKELIHTLTHEFGHALGMQHVENPQAIMYPYTTSFLALTSEDLNQLSYVCRKQPLPLHWIIVFDKWLFSSVGSFVQYYLNQANGVALHS